MPERITEIVGSTPYNRLRQEAEERARRAAEDPSLEIEPPVPADRTRTLGVIAQRQVGNGCGTTALAMALTYSLGRRVTQGELDAEVRLLDVFSSAMNLRDAARKSGVDARLVNNLSAREVMAQIDRGRPIVFLTDLTPNDPRDLASMHYRVIDGYRWNDDRLELRIVDPWDIPRAWISWQSLQPQWANVKGLGAQLGYNRFGIVIGANTADKALPAERLSGIRVTETAADGIADVTNDAARIRRGRLASFFTGAVSLLRALVALVAFPFRKLFGWHVDGSDGNNAEPPSSVQTPPRLARSARWAQPVDTERTARASVLASEGAYRSSGLTPPRAATRRFRAAPASS